MEVFNEPNPELLQENFFQGYQKNIDKLARDPEIIEWDKLCFELFFVNDQGKRFLEIVKERYLFPSLANPGSATYPYDVMRAEGLKDFGRMLYAAVKAHQQRIKSGS